MNFLKISGLVIGTGSVVGGTGAGVYYGVIKNSEATNDKNNSGSKSNEKISFVGKLVFFKKSGSGTDALYEAKLLTDSECNDEIQKFNQSASEGSKHENVNKFIEVSYLLNIENATSTLKNIFGNEITLTNAKAKITSEATKLKELLGEAIYENLKTLIP